jgi:hypothetical protein
VLCTCSPVCVYFNVQLVVLNVLMAAFVSMLILVDKFSYVALGKEALLR